MKFLLLLLVFVSCTKKYQTYHVIDKYRFDNNNPEVPITRKMLPYKKETRSHCAGQFFWSSNAQKQTDRYLSRIVQNMCGDSKYLVNNRLEEIWWTTIIYSRSCVKLEAYCPREKN